MNILEFITKKCYDFRSLYATEEQLNSIGLTIQQTMDDKMILCRIRGGKPIAENLATDHIYVGDIHSLDREIPPRLLQIILEFIQDTSSEPAVVNYDTNTIGGCTTGIYGKIIVHNDKMGAVVQDLFVEDPNCQNIIKAVREWLNG